MKLLAPRLSRHSWSDVEVRRPPAEPLRAQGAGQNRVMHFLVAKMDTVFWVENLLGNFPKLEIIISPKTITRHPQDVSAPSLGSRTTREPLKTTTTLTSPLRRSRRTWGNFENFGYFGRVVQGFALKREFRPGSSKDCVRLPGRPPRRQLAPRVSGVAQTD